MPSRRDETFRTIRGHRDSCTCSKCTGDIGSRGHSRELAYFHPLDCSCISCSILGADSVEPEYDVKVEDLKEELSNMSSKEINSLGDSGILKVLKKLIQRNKR